MIHALTIDVEDYWSIISRDRLSIPDAVPTEAVVQNTRWFLQTLDEHNVRATFFILGEVAETFPSLVKQIHNCGHEIGVHGFRHRQIFRLSPDEFKKEVSDCKKILEDLIADAVIGHRAPAFSIMPETKWAFDVLCDVGFQYDSSVFPIAGKRYGWPGFSNEICSIKTHNAEMIEVPMSTLPILGKTLPVAGGGYLRHFPYVLNRIAIARIQQKRPVIVYMHPYEIERPDGMLDVSRLNPQEKKKLRRMHKIQLRNRHTMKDKVTRLLRDFKFSTLKEVIQTQKTHIKSFDIR